MNKTNYSITHTGYNEWYTDMMIACGGMGTEYETKAGISVSYDGTVLGFWDEEEGNGYSLNS